MEIRAIRTAGLGDTSYVVSLDGVAVVVDPQRDIDRFLEPVEAAEAELRLVLETHVHNDYVSGGRDLARVTGAELAMPAGAAPTFRHRPAFHNEEIDVGPMRIRPIHTPGHTPEHTSYLFLVEGRETAVFTGGSLLTGSAGRTDLLGNDRAETLARLQYSSLRRLALLPGRTRLCPTHGAGSFCTVGPSRRAQSTVADEIRLNPALSHQDEESFVAAQLSDLPPYPDYYRHMARLNLAGLPPFQPDLPSEVTPADLHRMADEVVTIDARPVRRYAEGHIPGSLSVELRRDFGVWVGWLVEHGAPVALVLDEGQDLEEAMRQLARIGYDDVRGVVWSLEGWPDELATMRWTDVAGFADAVTDGEQVVDTRSPSEWATGTIEGSHLIYAPQVRSGSWSGLERERPVWLACASGYRAGIAASLIERDGFQPVVLAEGGVPAVLREMSLRADRP